MKQRYDTKHPHYEAYTDFFMRYKVESNILNAGAQSRPSAYTVLWDKVNIENEILKRVGDSKGKYMQSGLENTAYIPFVEMQLNEIDRRFKTYQRKRLNMGYSETDEMPSDLLKEQLKKQARLDVIKSEVEVLNKKLKEYTDVIEKDEDERVLEYGLQGSGVFHGTKAKNPDLINVLKEMDGQRLELNADGLLIIKDKRSPYNGMSVADFRALCVVYKQMRREQDRAKLKRLQAEAREQGLPVPQQLPAHSLKKVNKKSLPDWPEGVRNYLEVNEDSESSLTRTKK